MLQMWSFLTLTFLPEESANAWQFKTHEERKVIFVELRLYVSLQLNHNNIILVSRSMVVRVWQVHRKGKKKNKPKTGTG